MLTACNYLSSETACHAELIDQLEFFPELFSSQLTGE